jgi:hypothetical protein
MAALPPPEESARSEIAAMAGIFEQDGDPSAAWRAFYLARKFGCEIPPSIDAEINRFAEAVGAVAERAHNGDHRATIDNETVGKIWKNYRNRDSGGATFRARRAYDIAVEVEKLRRSGFSSSRAVETVCKRKGVYKTTVEKAMQRHAEVRLMGTDELGAV